MPAIPLPIPGKEMFNTLREGLSPKGSKDEVKSSSLSDDLRFGTGDFLKERRRVVALSLVACTAMTTIARYQVGLSKRLPNPPLPFFNAEKVDAADEAYSRLQTPDGLLGLASYAVTACLAAAGGKDRAKSHPWLPLALAGKVLLFDTPLAAQLTVTQWTKQRAFCVWCLAASAMTFVSAPVVLPEARHALAHLFGRGD